MPNLTCPSPRRVSGFLFIVMLLQPLLDVVSYFWALSGHGNLFTLALRMVVLAITALAGFCMSRRKKVYWIAAGVCCLFWAAHVLCCLQAGYQSPFADFTNYIRVVQIVVYTLSFITFLQQGEDVFRAVMAGFCVNLCVCAVVMLLSSLTGTDPHTYVVNQLGILGWFSTSNSQSAILSVSAPVVLTLAFLYSGKRQYLLMLLASVLCLVPLYFIGTRLAFATLLGTAVVLPVILALCRRFDWKKTAMVLLCAAVCVAGYKVSPMYQNQHIYNNAMSEKQGWAEIKIQRAEESLKKEEAAAREDPSIRESTPAPESEEVKILRLTPVYEWCAANIVDRFGVEAVIRKYNFSSSVQEITAVRRQKIYFCEMLQDELPVTAKIFGMELGRMTHKDKVYDVENDFYGIYFLYGIVGLVLLLGFIGYFLLLILRAMLRDPRTYFTPLAGAIGLSLGIILIYAFCTAGVLRRPNASFYLSMLLALVYYLTKIKVYPKAEEPAA